MQRIVLGVLLVLVCLAGLWLSAAVLWAADFRSEAVGLASVAALILLVAVLASLAAVQAWDRGAKVRAAVAIFLVEAAAAVALYGVFFPRALGEAWRLLPDLGFAALLGLILCGFAVVEAPARDRWIAHAAAVFFALAYGIYLLLAHGGVRGEFFPRAAAGAYCLGMTGTAAFSLRARLAYLARVAARGAGPPAG